MFSFKRQDVMPDEVSSDIMSLKVIRMVPKRTYNFILTFHNNYGRSCTISKNSEILAEKCEFFLTPSILTPPMWFSFRLCNAQRAQKTIMDGHSWWSGQLILLLSAGREWVVAYLVYRLRRGVKLILVTACLPNAPRVQILLSAGKGLPQNALQD